MDRLDRAGDVCHLSLQANVHNVHVDVDRVVPIVTIQVQQVLLAAHTVLLGQGAVASQLVLQIAIVCVVHRKLRIIASAWWHVCARIRRLGILLCAATIEPCLNGQRLLLAL